MRKLNKLVSVVIVSKDRKKDLTECVESYLKSRYRPIEIIVVDNASSPPISTWLKKKYPKVKLITLSRNVGAAEGRNIGLRASKGEFVLFTDDDAYADRDMLHYIVKVFDQNEDAGVVQPLVYDKQKRNMLQGAGHNISVITGGLRAWGVREIDKGQYEGVREVPMCGCVWMVRREVFEKVGEYDEDYFIPYEDSDFSLRARKKGFKLYCVSAAKTWHQGPKTTFVHPWLEALGITSSERAFRTMRNKMIFMRKHSPFPFNLIFFLVLFPIYIIAHTLIIGLAGRFDVLIKYWHGVFSGLLYILKYNRFSIVFAFFLLSSIIFTTYIVHQPSLDFALWGDDWIALYTFKYNFGPGTTYEYTSYKTYFGGYAMPQHLANTIFYFWGTSHKAYFVFTLIFRILASFGLSFLSFKLTKSRFSALITGLFFAISPVGLETTNWGGWNMATYLVIFFFPMATWFLITSYQKFGRYLISLFFLFLTIMMFPQRAQSASLFFVAVDTLWLFKNFKIKPAKVWFKRQIFLFLLVWVLTSLGTFGSRADRNWFFDEVGKDLSNAKHYFWVSLLPSFSNMILPDEIWINQKVTNAAQGIIGSVVTPRIRPLFFGFTLIALGVSLVLRKKRFLFFLISFSSGLIFSYYLKIVLKDQPNPLLFDIHTIFPAFIGGYLIIFLLIYFLINQKDKFSFYLMIVTLWPFVLATIAWARNHFSIFGTTFRYTTVPGAFFPILIGLILANIKHTPRKLIFLSVIIFLGLLYTNASHSYLNKLHKVRNSNLYDSLWSDLFRTFPDYKATNFYPVIYFEDDVGNPGALYHAIIFGAAPRWQLYYSIRPEDNLKIPMFIDRFEDLVEVLTKGEFLERGGRESGYISPERLYAFRIEAGNLVDIKEETLNRLKEHSYPKH